MRRKYQVLTLSVVAGLLGFLLLNTLGKDEKAPPEQRYDTSTDHSEVPRRSQRNIPPSEQKTSDEFFNRTTRPEDRIEDIAGYVQGLIRDNSDHDERSTLHRLLHAMGVLPDHAEKKYICRYEIQPPGETSEFGTSLGSYGTLWVDTHEELEEKVSEIRRRRREGIPEPVFPTSIDECNANLISTYVSRDSTRYNRYASELVEALGEAQMIEQMIRVDNQDEGRGFYANVDAALDFYYQDIGEILRAWHATTPKDSKEREYVDELLEILGGEESKQLGLQHLQDFIEDGTY